MVYDFYPTRFFSLSEPWFNKIIYHHKSWDSISLFFVFAMQIILTITFYLTLPSIHYSSII